MQHARFGVSILRGIVKINLDIYSDECGPTSFLCRDCANKLKRLDEANKSVSESNSYLQYLLHGRELTQIVHTDHCLQQ